MQISLRKGTHLWLPAKLESPIRWRSLICQAASSPASLCSGTCRSPAADPIRILRLGQVIEATGPGKSKIYELQATGNFPMRVQITSHCVGWVEEEIQMWLAHRIASRPSPRSATIGKIRRTRESCAIRSRAHAPVSGGSTGTVIRYRGSNLPSLTSERLPLPSLIRLSFSFARQGCLARSAR